MFALCLAALTLGLPSPADAGAPAAQTPAGQPQSVRRLTLDQALALAAATSPVLDSERAAYRVIRVGVAQAAEGFTPSLALNATGAGGASGQKQVSLGLQQLLFDGGRVLEGIRAARSGEQSAAYVYQRQLQTLSLNVAQAYYGALQAQSQVALAQEIVKQNQLQERLVAAQIRAGTAARIDLATARIPTTQARVALVRAQGAQTAALAAFAGVLGLNADAAVEPAEDPSGASVSLLPSGTPTDFSAAAARALSMRPDYHAAQALVESAHDNVRSHRLGQFPSLSLVANGGYQNSGLPIGFQGSAQAGISLDIPILDRTDTLVQTQLAQAQEEQAQAQLASTQLAVQVDVRQSLAGVTAAQSALTQVDTELAEARDVLQATQRQYTAGQTTLPLLLNAQAQLSSAETDRVTALYVLRQAEQTYLYALGQNDEYAHVSTGRDLDVNRS
jgi:outer membrane protein